MIDKEHFFLKHLYGDVVVDIKGIMYFTNEFCRSFISIWILIFILYEFLKPWITCYKDMSYICSEFSWPSKHENNIQNATGIWIGTMRTTYARRRIYYHICHAWNTTVVKHIQLECPYRVTAGNHETKPPFTENKDSRFDNFVVTDGTVSCRYDNLRYHQ